MPRFSFLLRLLLFLIIPCIVIACGQHSRDGRVDRETNIRVINAIPDVPALDFYLDNKLYLSEVRYLENSGYSKEDTGGLGFQANISGTGTRLVDTSVGFSDNRDSTLLVFGRANDPSFLALRDDNDPASSDVGKIRIINAAFDYRRVDIYIVEGNQSIANLAPANDGIAYRDVSRYALLTDGTYSIIATTRGSKTPIATLSNVNIKGEGVYSLIIADGLPLSPSTHPKLVFLTDR